ncbi:MAG: hypothetical protein WB676_20270 [Bryobacteraceae bacterium]
MLIATYKGIAMKARHHREVANQRFTFSAFECGGKFVECIVSQLLGPVIGSANLRFLPSGFT